ncbi:hypothetical protein NIES2101_38770 [Calothrix sp. HK-06]|nr:hypothetical protein NIES2101_38770 [Calothrix sp. HK-06]
MVQSLQQKKIMNLEPIHQNVTVNVKYNVYLTTGLFNFKNPLLARFIAGKNADQPKQVLAIVDEELLRTWCRLLWQLDCYSKLYSNMFTLICKPLVVPKEEVKTYIHWREQFHKLIEPVKLEQECYLLAIGGQNVLTLADYLVTSTYRQINLIRVPVTLMAPNYLGIGERNQTSKTIKNINNFTLPYTVFNDFAFIKKMDETEWRSSIIEAIRLALMLDADFFEFLAENISALVARDVDIMQQAVHRYAKSCLTHFSTNSNPYIIRNFNPFDFGDWSISKLEKLTNRLHSSEALAIGIALNSTYSYLIGMLSRLEWQKILKILVVLSFDLYVPELAQQADKLKNSSQSQISSTTEEKDGLSLKLAQRIGKGTEVYEVNLSLYRQAIIMVQEFVENNPKLVITPTTKKNFKHRLYESKPSRIQSVAIGYNVG